MTTAANVRKLMPGAVVEIDGATATIRQRGQRNFDKNGALVKGATVTLDAAELGSRWAWFPYTEMTLVKEAPKVTR